MALDDFEVAPEYQALHHTAFRDGGVRHAHNLRALSRSVNQLALEGEPLLSLSWDSRRQPDSEQPDEKAVRAVCSPSWTRLLPGVHRCPKMPGFMKADFFVQAEITEDAQVYLQIETSNSTLDIVSDYPSGRVFELKGTGALELYELTDIPVSSGLYERIGFWIRGKRTNTLGDATVHAGNASHNRGLVSRIDANGYCTVPGMSWNVRPNDNWAIDHVLEIHDGPDVSTPGTVLYSGQFIDIEDLGGGTYKALLFRPPYDFQSANGLGGHYFQIFELPKVRIVSIDAYTQDREE